jgi:hypothetical protein
MEPSESSLKTIKEVYTKALELINTNDCKSADRLVRDMNIDDYDLSIDIIYNYNDKYSNEELRKLILQVDDALTIYSKIPFRSKLEENSDESEDTFIESSY